MRCTRQLNIIAWTVIAALTGSCGAPPRPIEPEPTPPEANAGPLPIADAGAAVDAAVDAVADEPSPAPKEEPAPTVETPSPPIAIELEPLQGPYKKLAEYCAEFKRDGRGRCLKGKTYWATGDDLGARGAIRRARTFRVASGRGDSAHELCPLAIQIRGGWYVAADNARCQLGDPEEPDLETTLSRFRWADELGFGVLEVERVQNGDLERELAGTAEEPVIATSSGTISDRRYCGLDAQGLPRCTPWLAVEADAFDINSNVEIEHKDGLVKVTGSWQGEPAALAAARALEPGSYRVPTEPATPDGIVFAAIEDLVDPDEGPGPGPYPMFGPFPSLDEYCRELPTFWDSVLPSDEYEQEYEDEYNDVSCARGKGPWNRKPALKRRSPFLGAELLRIHAKMAGAPIEYCRVALRTNRGWFVSTEARTCKGVLGPSSDVTTRTVQFRWEGDEQDLVLGLEYEAITESVSYSDRGYYDDIAAGSGKQGKKRSYGKQEIESEFRSWGLRICGIGPSGIPSCTADISNECELPGHSFDTVRLSWKYAGGKLIQSAPAPKKKKAKKKSDDYDDDWVDEEPDVEGTCYDPKLFPMTTEIIFP